MQIELIQVPGINWLNLFQYIWHISQKVLLFSSHLLQTVKSCHITPIIYTTKWSICPCTMFCCCWNTCSFSPAEFFQIFLAVKPHFVWLVYVFCWDLQWIIFATSPKPALTSGNGVRALVLFFISLAGYGITNLVLILYLSVKCT